MSKNAFYRNVNSINLKIFPTHFEKKFNKHSGDRDKALGSLWKYEKMYPWGSSWGEWGGGGEGVGGVWK